MIETEVKIKISDEELKGLQKLIGEPEFFQQKNYIYDLGKEFFRIREEQDKVIVTFKGEKQESKFNSREEIEFGANGDYNTLKLFFERLGFKKNSLYEKQRAYSPFNECTICLDCLPNGENYIEVEGDEEKIISSLEKLGLRNHEIEKRSYQEIMGGFCRDGMY